MKALLACSGELSLAEFDVARYLEAYSLYAAGMERALEQLSTAARFRKGPYYVLKYGGKYGPGQRKLAAKASKLRRFFDLDVFSSIMFARILLDRAIALSRSFFRGERLPSFTSFSEHKKFLAKGNHDVPNAYADHLIRCTGWFGVPLKLVRDKFIVHAGPAYVRMDTIPWTGDDMLITFVPRKGGFDERVGLNMVTLSYEIEEFLKWFAKYGLDSAGEPIS